jgi:Uma2 family endonuclease
MAIVTPNILEWRKKTGAHQFDEMWDGVLHMPPMPNRFHQDLEGALEVYLRVRWGRPNQSKVYHQINLAPIGGWPNNYRIPDLLLLKPERFAIDRNEYFEGAPNVVVEIHSPGDETYDKLPFYRDLGVDEVWIIHRDTRVPEIHALKRGRYKVLPANADGWIRSPVTNLELKATDAAKLAIRIANDDSTREDLPDD